MLLTQIGSTLANLIVLAALPLGGYLLYQKWRGGMRVDEGLKRVGLRKGNTSYIWLCVAVSVLLAVILVLFPPPLEPFTREGSAQASFAGLGVGGAVLAAALLYGVMQTGFSEELLFRGLIAGALSRKLSLPWANLIQALIFLLPHLALLFIMPEMWWVLLLVLTGGLFVGWVRIKSGSIIGPWILHSAVNVTMALSVAVRSAG
jgi:membrane protease YdiL (CAAX protease family)